LNTKPLDEQLKEIEKYAVLGNDKMQELLQCKDYFEDMLSKVNTHLEYKTKDLKTIEECRDEVTAHQRAIAEHRESERKAKMAKSPFDIGDKSGAQDKTDDDEELLQASPFGTSSSPPFSASTGPSPFTSAAANKGTQPFADSVKSQADMMQLIQTQVDKRMEAVANDFTNQLLQVQRTLMEAVMAKPTNTPPQATAPTPTTKEPITPTQRQPEDHPRTPRHGQERFDSDRSPSRPNIKQATMKHNANTAATSRLETERSTAKQDKLEALRQQETAATVDLTADDTPSQNSPEA
jgi:hypothetical protein